MSNSWWNAFATLAQNAPAIGQAYEQGKRQKAWADVLKGMPQAQPNATITESTVRTPEQSAAVITAGVPKNPIPLPGGSAMAELAADPQQKPASMSKDEWKRIMRESMDQIESGGGANTDHLEFSKGKKVIGRYGINPWTWFKTIGLDPDNAEHRREFENNQQLQLKALDNVLDDAYQRSGGDPMKATAIYYGGPEALNKLGNSRGDKRPIALDKKGMPVSMPSINQHVQKLAPALRKLGYDPETFLRTSTSVSASVGSDMSQPATKKEMSALQALLEKGAPVAPKTSRRVGGAGEKAKYLIEKLNQNPALWDDPKAVSMVETLSALAKQEAAPDAAAQDAYEHEATRYANAASTQAQIEAQDRRYQFSQNETKTAKESQAKLNAMKAEGLNIQAQIKDLDKLMTLNPKKMEPQQIQALQANYKDFFKTQAKDSFRNKYDPTRTEPEMETVIDQQSISRVRQELVGRYRQLQGQLSQAGGADYMPSEIQDASSDPHSFLLN